MTNGQMSEKIKIREIRYIHQGSTNGIGWQAYIYTKDGDIKILKESIDKKVIIEYTTNYNEKYCLN